MNKEQIEELLKAIEVEDASGFAHFEVQLDAMEDLCNTALNSIPRVFDEEDETTWPEKEGVFVVFSTFPKARSLGRWDGKKWSSIIVNIARYMPIPEIEKENAEDFISCPMEAE